LRSVDKRRVNKAFLQKSFGLATDGEIAVLAWVGRLVQQKGIDLLIEILPKLMQLPLQIVVVGSGEARYEQILLDWAKLYPDRIAIKLGYSEANAHLIEAGTDIFLMPSRFEPCGLNQMYSQRYGAVPLVRRIGGLADTVQDANPHHLGNGTATGISFDAATADALCQAINRALALYHNRHDWRKVQNAGMSKDFSWESSAQRYLDLYGMALDDCAKSESLLRVAG
ncbi:glycogen synthase, partial [Methylomagnum sp.]